MTVSISRAVRTQILDHVRSLPEEEVCGLLLGGPGHIDLAIPAENVASDRRRRFEIDPKTLISAYRAARQGGPQPIGHYHSHPTSRAWPSQRDAGDAKPGQLWLIAGMDQLALFEAVDHGSIQRRFRELHLEIM